MEFLSSLKNGIPLDPLPELSPLDQKIPHAPRRTPKLSESEYKQAIKNALRYFPSHLHATLLPEFKQELDDFGHIYMHRFRPSYNMKAYPMDLYPAKDPQCKAIQHMIMNVLDPAVAQFPQELITYGGNGSVFQNWAQYHLTMQYLSTMDTDQTLVLNSGHPVGIFPSSAQAPRVMVSNGLVIPNYSS
jgi:urocanate hydratase